MTWFSFSSLRARLLLLGFFAVVPALELMVVAHLEQRRLVTAKAKEDALKVAQLVARDYDDVIEGARQLLITLAQLSEVRAAGAAECSQLLAKLLKQYRRYTNFGAAHINGDVFCSAIPPTRPVNLAGQPVFQRAVEARQFVVSEYLIGHVSGKPSITFAYPVLGVNGETLGAVFAGVDLDWLTQPSPKLYSVPGTTLVLLDHNGTILAQNPGPKDRVGKRIPDAALLGTMLAKREGATETRLHDGHQQLIGFASLSAGAEPDFYVTVGVPRASAFAGINRTFRQQLLWLAIVALLAITVTWIGSNLFILRHVKTMLRATRRLADGDLSARVGLSSRGQGEFGELAHAFDEMAASLEKAEKEKADFSAMIVHDLRSPLTAVIGAASILEEGLAGPVSQEQKMWAGKIQAGTRTLLGLINDFLDLSKLESGHIDLVKEETDLKELVQSTLDQYRILAQKKKISLVSSVISDLPRIHADPRRLDQVLANLLSNAVKFTGEGGEIEVGASQENAAETKLWVKDNGVGIAAEEIGQLFEKYRQTTSGKTSTYKGTGLGLVICKMIVEAHGGRIWVESEERKGTTLFFTLPLTA